MAEVTSIDSAARIDPFESAKRIVIAGGDVAEIADTLMISERRARALFVKANASITVDDYSWTPEQEEAFARAATIRIAAEGMMESDPKQRKLALDALAALRNRGSDHPAVPERPNMPTLTVDPRSIIDNSYSLKKGMPS